jgi:predicted DNA binding protein
VPTKKAKIIVNLNFSCRCTSDISSREHLLGTGCRLKPSAYVAVRHRVSDVLAFVMNALSIDRLSNQLELLRIRAGKVCEPG